MINSSVMTKTGALARSIGGAVAVTSILLGFRVCRRAIHLFYPDREIR